MDKERELIESLLIPDGETEGMSANLLSLKNLYRVLTVNDYPVYSNGIISERERKGMTLIRFWSEVLIPEWKETPHGKTIWRVSGTKNRLHSELCNRKDNIYNKRYAAELLEKMTPELFFRETASVESFLSRKKYSSEVFRRKMVFLVKALAKSDPSLSAGTAKYLVDLISADNSPLPEGFVDAYAFSLLTLHAIAGTAMDSSAMFAIRRAKDFLPGAVYAYSQKPQEEIRWLSEERSGLYAKPLSPAHFFGRQDTLFDLCEMACQGGHYLITGIGGTGKTELMRQMLQELIENKKIQAAALVQYETDLVTSFATAFSKEAGSTPREKYNAAILRLRQENRNTLLIIDNAEQSQEDDKAWTETASLPCTVFVTSRMKKLDGFETFEVPKLSMESAKLIYRDSCEMILGSEDKAYLEKMIRERNAYYPLTLKLFGSVAGSRKWTPQQLDEKLSSIAVPSGRIREIQKVYRQLYAQSELSAQNRAVIRMFSLLPYRSYEPLFLSECLGTAVTLSDLESLAKTGWLENTEGSFSLHPAVAEMIRSTPLKEEEFHAFWTHAKNTMHVDLIADEADENTLQWAGLLHYGVNHLAKPVSSDLIRQDLLSACVLISGGRASAGIARECMANHRKCSETTSENKALEMLLKLVCHDISVLDDALKMISDKAFMEKVPGWIGALIACNAGALLMSVGRIEDGRNAVKAARDMDHSEMLGYIAEHLMGTAAIMASDFEESDRIYNILLKKLEQKHLDTGKTGYDAFLNYISTLMIRGRMAEAEPLVQKAAAALPANAPYDTRSALEGVQGKILENKKDYEGALNAFFAARKHAQLSAEGSEYNILIQTQNIGQVYGSMGKYKEAMATYDEVLEQLKAVSPESPSVLVTLSNAAVAAIGARNWKKAEDYITRGLSYEGRIQAPPAYAIMRYNLSRVRRNEGREKEEQALLEECLPVLKEIFGEENYRVVDGNKRLKALKRQNS